jgi:hypothetical protein
MREKPRDERRGADSQSARGGGGGGATFDSHRRCAPPAHTGPSLTLGVTL